MKTRTRLDCCAFCLCHELGLHLSHVHFLWFHSSRVRSEQSLVRWATPQLHDIDALAKMVDPTLNGMYPAKSLSRFADIIALCVQVSFFSDNKTKYAPSLSFHDIFKNSGMVIQLVNLFSVKSYAHHGFIFFGYDFGS